MVRFDGLSTAAKAGKILILVAIVLSVIGMIASGLFSLLIIFFGLDWVRIPFIPQLGIAIIGVTLAIKIVGIVLAILAFRDTERGNFYRAGILAIIASFVPPLDVIMIIGGILCLVSDEAIRRGAVG
jgi:hypothetical protein